MMAVGSLECSRPSAWPSSWTATRNRSFPVQTEKAGAAVTGGQAQSCEGPLGAACPRVELPASPAHAAGLQGGGREELGRKAEGRGVRPPGKRGPLPPDPSCTELRHLSRNRGSRSRLTVGVAAVPGLQRRGWAFLHLTQEHLPDSRHCEDVPRANSGQHTKTSLSPPA